LGTRFAKLQLGETRSWSFPRCIPKQELGNEGNVTDIEYFVGIQALVAGRMKLIFCTNESRA
jgi:hypothetical protein